MVKKNKARFHRSDILDEFLSEIHSEEGVVDYKKVEARMCIAARIDDALQKNKISKMEFATKMNQMPSVVTKWLSGTHNFTIDTLIEIEIVLKISLLRYYK